MHLLRLGVLKNSLHCEFPEDVALLVECFPSMHEAIGFIPSTPEQGRVGVLFDPNTWDLEA